VWPVTTQKGPAGHRKPRERWAVSQDGWMFLSHLGSGGTERQVEAGTRRGGGRPEESIFALGAMTQLMRSYRGASIAG